MTRPTRHPETAGDMPDSSLRAAMRAGLPQPDDADMQALQARVMAQWQLRSAASAGTGAPASSVLSLRGLNRRLVVLLGTAVVLGAMTTAVLWPGADPAMEELLEPDVLSLISLGQL